MPNSQDELLAKLLDGSLTPSEWKEAQEVWGDETLRMMLAGEQKLRFAYQHMSTQMNHPDMISSIMHRVETAPAPNRALLWILKYGGLIGTFIFVLGLSTVLVVFSDSASPTFTFTAPTVDSTLALWGLPVMILIGVGIWRMETA